MDFCTPQLIRKTKGNILTVDFKVIKSKDLMIRGKTFYAVYNKHTELWDDDYYTLTQLIDDEINKAKNEVDKYGKIDAVYYMSNFTSGLIESFNKYARNVGDNYTPLNSKVIFANTEVKKDDYATFKLPYNLEEGPIDAYNELVGTLYSEEERQKFEWAIGSIIAGDSKKIQKFFVFYGGPGTGKSTVLGIMQKIFDGYWSIFEAKRLVGHDSFALDMLSTNPLLAIQHDGDLSKIEDNTKLNSIVSHEPMVVNEKFKAPYVIVPQCMLFMGTNTPVKITDEKSGIKRRLVDIQPTGRKVDKYRYDDLMEQILNFELGGIAYHCLQVYKELGRKFYDKYDPVDMSYKTDMFFNFVEENRFIFKEHNECTLKQAFDLYKQFIDDSGLQYRATKQEVREKLKDYFLEYYPETRINDNVHVRNYYRYFRNDIFEGISEPDYKPELESWLNFKNSAHSKLDDLIKDCPAQYAKDDGIPTCRWDDCKTYVKNINTTLLHYVRVPENHIVIDFDLKDENGEKSFQLNYEAASKWPKTYAEISKSGAGIHLHYLYSGDPTMLSANYADSIEIKVFTGKSSLRRKLTKCNDLDIATINSGLPLKEKKKVVNYDSVKNEKMLRRLIIKNLNKEIHSATKPSIDFIFKLLEDAYNSGISYDVSDMRQAILNFAMNSSHQSDYCTALVAKMKFKSEEASNSGEYKEDSPIVFYDIEVFPNLLLICYKKKGGDKKFLFNPSPAEIEELFNYKLVGFNCRRYDNHIIYAGSMGYTLEQLYNLSKRIINAEKSEYNAFFSEAYNISYTDIYDYSSKKQSLKKWEIELGIHHQELGFDWDKPVPEELWPKVAEYCGYDVDATEATWDATQDDFTARLILAEIAGGIPNDTTNTLTAKLIFGNERKPNDEFRYRNLAEPVYELDNEMLEYLKENFPEMMAEPHGDAKSLLPYFKGYTYENKVSTYKGEEIGEGGLVRAKPGIYGYSKCFDVNSEHPHSALTEYLFGKYTVQFHNLIKARLSVKHGRFDIAEKLFDGKLVKYLSDKSNAKKLAFALKIAINAVYGLTAAKFQNKFTVKGNDDNIVAKRGALFMVDLKNAVEELGYTVIHVKTDSIKVDNPDQMIEDYIMWFGKRYGYTFEVEHVFEKFCLVNDAVYVAKLAQDDPDEPGQWTATGTQFKVPYVFKTLFSKEDIEFFDLCETKQVSVGSIYIDMNEGLPEGEHNYVFVGKVGQFCPIKEGCGGGVLYRYNNDKYDAITGTKGYRWLESEVVKELEKEDDIDISYYESMVSTAIETIKLYDTNNTFLE